MQTSPASPAQRPASLERLTNVRFDAALNLHVATLTIGSQQVRVALRPGPTVEHSSHPPAPLLLFNGIGANLELVAPFLKAMPQCEVIVFDVPGAGQSPAPQWPYRLFSMARLAAGLLDTLGYGEVDVLGVSWGGGLAQQFAIQYPARVRRLVLAATAMGGVSMVPGRPQVLWKMLNPRRYVDRGYMRSIAADIYGGSLRTNVDDIELFLSHAKGGNRRGYRYQMLAMMGWTSLPWLWRIRQPTLILAGDDDPLVPLINARVQASIMRNARLHVVNDGHLFLLTRAAEVAPVVLDFLLQAGATAVARPRNAPFAAL